MGVDWLRDILGPEDERALSTVQIIEVWPKMLTYFMYILHTFSN
jgi:hypothetical protein